MNSISLREARSEDVHAIMQLIGQSDMSPNNPLTLEEASAIFATIASTHCHKVYVAELADSIVGTYALIVIQSLTHNGGRSCVIEDVVIRKDLQGQGLGRRMMNHAVAQAKALGCGKMVLSSGQARTHAHDFYEHLGFTRDGYRFALDLAKNG